MKIVVNIPDALLDDVNRIRNNNSVKDLLEHRHELSKVYEPIVANISKTYERVKKLESIKNDKELIAQLDNLSLEEVQEYCIQNSKELYVRAGGLVLV